MCTLTLPDVTLPDVDFTFSGSSGMWQRPSFSQNHLPAEGGEALVFNGAYSEVNVEGWGLLKIKLIFNQALFKRSLYKHIFNQFSYKMQFQ